MKRIRLLHLIASSRGGGATHVRSLALGLDPTRFAVQVAMPEDGGHVGAADFQAAGIPFHRVDIAEGLSIGEIGWIRRLASSVDILHIHGARAALHGRFAVATARRRKPRVVYTIHAFALPYYALHRRIALLAVERMLASRTDAVIAVCHQERRAFLAQRITVPERVSVVWNSVDSQPFRGAEASKLPTRVALGLPPDATVITTVCRLHKQRDFDTLLRAFARLAHPGRALYLLVVGDGPDRPKVEALIEELGLGSTVILTGQRTDIPEVLAASDIFTLTAWGWEGLPIAVLEAMAAGLPVVASDAGGNSEAIVEEETGLLVPRRDVVALADGFARLVGNTEMRVRMGAAGRQRAEAVFSPERMIELTTKVYDQVLAREEHEPVRSSQPHQTREEPT